METLKRQSVGIDIAMETFTVSICKIDFNSELWFSEIVEFKNKKQGFNQFIKWSRKHLSADLPAIYVMEATGIYYEPLAYHLNHLNLQVAVVLPNKVKFFGKSLNVKSKTDAIDAKTIAQLGAERKLQNWEPPAPIFKELRALTRLRSDLVNERCAFQNKLKSIKAGNEPLGFVIKTYQTFIQKLKRDIKQCEEEIKELINSDEWLKQKVNKLLTIPGVGLTTIAVIIAETQGFKLFTSAKQLTNYAGYDVVQRDSGKILKGKTRISKKGNSRIRAVLYLPALAAAKHNNELKKAYHRINKNKTSKMVGVTALQRKLLVLCYSLWKNNTTYKTKNISEEQETKPLLRHKDEVFKNKVGRPTDLPTQDELPIERSTEALLRQIQIT